MTFTRKVRYFRVAVAVLVFLLLWLLLALGSALLDKDAVTSAIDDKLGIKFLSPNIRGVIHTHGWQVLAAMVVAWISYAKGKDFCTRILHKWFVQPDALAIGWGIVEEDPLQLPSEFIVNLQSGCWNPNLVIRNNGIDTFKITRIEAMGMVTRTVALRQGSGMEERVAEMTVEAARTTDHLFQWMEKAPGHWTLEGPLTLEEKQEQTLPSMTVGFDWANDDTVERMRLLVSEPSIILQLNFFVYGNETKLQRTLEAPVRIFPVFSELEGDQEINVLIDRLSVKDPQEAQRRRTAYTGALQLLEQAWNDYVTDQDQTTEKGLLVDWRRELEPYDRWIELEPHNPQRHLDRGRLLFDKGIRYEPLTSLQQAEALGLHTQEVLGPMARILVDLKQYQEALDALKRITPAPEADALLLGTRGEAWYNLQEYTHAKQDLERAIQLDPTGFQAYLFLGLTILHIDETDPNDVVLLWQQAVDHGFDNPDTVEVFSRMVGDPAHSDLLELAGRMRKTLPTENGGE